MKAKSGICIYCLTEKPNITVDHIIPNSWFPEGTPENTARWKAPACRDCNNRFSRIEKNLIERLGLCLNPNDPLVGDIARKAARALKPSSGRNPKDSARRAKKRDVIRAEILKLRGQPLKRVLPYFGPKPGTRPEGHASLLIPEADLKEFGRKLVRGMSFVTGGYILGPEYEVECYINTEDSDVQCFNSFYGTYAWHHDLAPGIEAAMIPCERPPLGLFRFKIWDRLSLHGAVLLAQDAEAISTDV